MALWAGIDEAGYGPPLGPLVVAGTAFTVKDGPAADPHGAFLWDALRDAVTRQARGSDGRLVVNDSKQVYSPAIGLHRLEEGVLSFLQLQARRIGGPAANVLSLLGAERPGADEPPAWFAGAAGLDLPLATNLSAVQSKASVLREALAGCGVQFVGARAAVVLPGEFNRVVSRTRNKSFLLFQKCGLILRDLWECAGPGLSHVLVDRHGGRVRYRRLLLDVFPACRCDVLWEQTHTSAYRIADARDEQRALQVTFLEEGDAASFTAALASMVAKYVREVYMLAFNLYWQQRLAGLKPTAGYHKDARRFLQDISPVLRADGVDRGSIVRLC